MTTCPRWDKNNARLCTALKSLLLLCRTSSGPQGAHGPERLACWIRWAFLCCEFCLQFRLYFRYRRLLAQPKVPEITQVAEQMSGAILDLRPFIRHPTNSASCCKILTFIVPLSSKFSKQVCKGEGKQSRGEKCCRGNKHRFMQATYTFALFGEYRREQAGQKQEKQATQAQVRIFPYLRREEPVPCAADGRDRVHGGVVRASRGADAGIGRGQWQLARHSKISKGDRLEMFGDVWRGLEMLSMLKFLYRSGRTATVSSS